MIAPLLCATEVHDQFVVSYGKSGAVGVFTPPVPLPLRRGEQVLIQTQRGTEVGTVLCPATLRQAHILGAVSTGVLLHAVSAKDAHRRAELAVLEQTIFETSRQWSRRDSLAVEILDVELFFDGRQAILQIVGEEPKMESLAQLLEQHFNLAIRLENLALPQHEEEHHGCDKPDCGRSADGGGCTSCGTGGGCSSCGSGKVDMRQYFGHLRDKMETGRRIPLT